MDSSTNNNPLTRNAAHDQLETRKKKAQESRGSPPRTTAATPRGVEQTDSV